MQCHKNPIKSHKKYNYTYQKNASYSPSLSQSITYNSAPVKSIFFYVNILEETGFAMPVDFYKRKFVIETLMNHNPFVAEIHQALMSKLSLPVQQI